MERVKVYFSPENRRTIMKRIDGNILIVDDDPDVLTTAEMLLKQIFPMVLADQNPENIPKHLSVHNFDVILLDMNFSPGKTDGKEGIYWLKKIRAQDPFIIVIMITAYADINLAVEAMKSGAADFIIKPWNNEKLLATISSAAELRKSRLEVEKLKNTRLRLNEDMNQLAGKLIGGSSRMKKLFQLIEKVAETDADVLILGENGTGKELVAREIHRQSKRNHQAFIPVDLGSISETLFESELFGHVKGAFTDAIEDKPGRFELASGGTIFLDEIGNLPPNLQSKILSVLQERKVTRVGSLKEISLDIRLISAANRDLDRMVDDKRFREDLLYRINTVEIHIPPLRDRLDDIQLLMDHFLNLFRKKYKKEYLKFKSLTSEKLKKHHWPGNVRELQHAVERAVILCDRNFIGPEEFSFRSGTSSSRPETLNLDEREKQCILKALEKNMGNVSAAAKDLGIARTAMYRRFKKYGI